MHLSISQSYNYAFLTSQSYKVCILQLANHIIMHLSTSQSHKVCILQLANHIRYAKYIKSLLAEHCNLMCVSSNVF